MKRQLYLYNTATTRKELFVPHDDSAPVGMYCCGPTVYNYAHIGNLRTYIFEDVLKRALVACGYDVKHVVNITDVGHLVSDADDGEDKMEKGAAREGKSVWDIAAFYTKKFMDDIASLNIVPPDLWPKATDHIPQMIEIVKSLEEKNYTYRTADGIYFDTAKLPSYCDFARIDPNSLRAGERVDMGEKRNVTDFALWKFSPRGAKRQMEWESPWGVGFPGWHIECSAMSLAYLAQPLDIHCGGADHIRVHHTNEIAQTEAATDKKFANYWLHGEFLVLDKGKMAKSGGNFVTLDSLKEKGISPLGYRMFCYTAHYRSPLTFSFEGAMAAEQGLLKLRRLVASNNNSECGMRNAELKVKGGVNINDNTSVNTNTNINTSTNVKRVWDVFMGAVCDDLNMPRAIAALWEGLRDDGLTAGEKAAFAEAADKVLGLDLFRAVDNDQRTEITEEAEGCKIIIISDVSISSDMKSSIIAKAVLRKKSRAVKDFKTADIIRDEFKALGVTVKDRQDGATECCVAGSATS